MTRTQATAEQVAAFQARAERLRDRAACLRAERAPKERTATEWAAVRAEAREAALALDAISRRRTS